MRLSQLVFFASLSVAVVAEEYVIHISYQQSDLPKMISTSIIPMFSGLKEGQSTERSFGLMLTAWTTEMAQSSPAVEV